MGRERYAVGSTSGDCFRHHTRLVTMVTIVYLVFLLVVVRGNKRAGSMREFSVVQKGRERKERRERELHFYIVFFLLRNFSLAAA